jgi:hypothetical protein
MGVWSAWGDCSATCSAGNTERTREITTQPSSGGSQCGATTESTMCDAGLCPVDCKVSGWSASGTCSLQCGGGEQTYVKIIEEQAVGSGAACPNGTDLVKTEACNTHACPWAPVGEAGMLTGIEVIDGVGSASVQFHVNYATQPAVFFGPAPKASDDECFAKVELPDISYTGVSLMQPKKSPEQPACNPTLLQKTGKQQPTCADLGLEPPVKQKPVPVGGAPPGAIDACKCIGPEAGDILFGKNNHQYPTLYGKYCFPWPARDPSAAMAQMNGDVQLMYIGGGALGDGWAFNPVTKMRVYVASLIDLTIQKPGEPVVFPEGVNVPDAPDPDAVYPSGEEDWCYVGADCPVAQAHLGSAVGGTAEGGKDGFHTWALCGKAWDSRPGVPYPNDPNTCPILGYDGPKPVLTALTRKNNGDVCVGTKGDNSCNDPSPTGGSVMGFVSSISMSPNMVMLQRAYNDDAGDTCVFPQGEMEKWCKAEGEYGSPTDLGWIMTEGLAGTTPLIGKFNKGSQDSCANTDTGDMTCGVTASKTSTTPAKYPVKVGTMGFLLKSQAEGAWSHCGPFEHYHASNEPGQFGYGLMAKKREGAWSVSASVKCEGKAPASSMKVAWMAFAQGVYKTASDTVFQVGIAPIVADGEEKTIPLHQEMGTAPIVISQPIGDGVVRQREASATDLYFIADGDGETVMVQWIAFESTDNGYFGSTPFVAGTLDGASGEEKTWPDGEFTQPPLVFASIATDRTDGDVNVRIMNNTPEGTVVVQEGSQTDEKVAYMAYNGKGQGGAAVNAETLLVQTYNWTLGAFNGCTRYGTKERPVGCEGSNGKTYDAAFCTAFAGSAAPDSSEYCEGAESIFEVEGKCLTTRRGSAFLEVVDCHSGSSQRFQMTAAGQLKSALSENLCLAAGADGTTAATETCSSGLESQQWYFEDGTLHSASGDTICLIVDPASKVNVLLGECGSTTWEAKAPAYQAKKYGYLVGNDGAGDCLAVEEGKKEVRGESCLHGSNQLGSATTQKWTLTMDDELKSDAFDECLTTTGLLSGEWTDAWNPKKPAKSLTLNDGNKVTTSGCTGELVGEWDDKWSPGHAYKICMDGNSVTTNGGATGTFLPPAKLTMNFAGTVLTATLDGDKLRFSNNNVWTKKAGSENVNEGSLDGDQLTWPFWTGTLTATLQGDKLQWTNGNIWTRTSTPALTMAPCTGSEGQKWVLEDSGDLKSQKDGITCVDLASKTTSPMGVAAGSCKVESWKVLEMPSWVTGA